MGHVVYLIVGCLFVAMQTVGGWKAAFRLLFWLAAAGAAIAYMPLLSNWAYGL